MESGSPRSNCEYVGSGEDAVPGLLVAVFALVLTWHRERKLSGVSYKVANTIMRAPPS